MLNKIQLLIQGLFTVTNFLKFYTIPSNVSVSKTDLSDRHQYSNPGICMHYFTVNPQQSQYAPWSQYAHSHCMMQNASTPSSQILRILINHNSIQKLKVFSLFQDEKQCPYCKSLQLTAIIYKYNQKCNSNCFPKHSAFVIY